MIEPLFNATDDEWVTIVGKYIINMGGVEASTRVLIAICEGTDNAAAMSADLPSRIGYLRRRFPRASKERHSWAMQVFDVASKHVGFRNIVAHSPIMITGYADGTRTVQGILNITPNDPHSVGQLIGLPELRGRVDESAAISRDLLKMQTDFRGPAAA
jgi:hypothetical protein